MASQVGQIVSKLYKPEYTGENRCVPCTIINIFIAAILATVLGIFSKTLGVAAFGLFVAAIYFQGYLIPGTPHLTTRYLPDWILASFDHHATQPKPTGNNQEFDVETTLADAQAVADCATGNDLCLTDEFQTAWRTSIEQVRDTDMSRRDLVTILSGEPDNLSFIEHGSGFVAIFDGRQIGQWESRAAFTADIAAAKVLKASYSEWASLDITQQSQMLGGLRIFLQHCPSCDGPVRLEEEQVRSCCRSLDVIAATCEQCGARLFETEHAKGETNK